MGPMGYFDGATQGEEMKCGVGAIIQVDHDETFQIIWNCGRGTNARGEMLDLCEL